MAARIETEENPQPKAVPRIHLLGGYTRYWLTPLLIVVGLFLILLMMGRQEESAFIYTLF